MPVQSTLTLNTKVYASRGTQNGISTWANQGDATFGGALTNVTESVRGPLQDGRSRIRFVLTIPKAATEDSQCGCAGSILGAAKGDIVIDVPGNFTAAERQDLRLRIQGLVANAVFTAAVDNLEGSWG